MTPVRRRIQVGLPRMLAWLLLAFLFAPMLVVIPVSLTDRDYLSLPQHGLSLAHYLPLLDWSAGWLPSILTSFTTALAASFAATTVAAAYAIGAWVYVGRWPSFLRVVLLSPLIVPPIIYAVGIVRLWSRLGLLDSWIGVVIVHVMLAIPLAVLAIGASLSNLDPRIVQAARSLGARPPTIFARVILPNLASGIGAGAVLAFITSWDEITVTLFITSRRLVTLPRRIWTSIADSVDPTLAAIASVMLLATLLGLLVRVLFFERGRPARSTRKSLL
ncbi:ABC transporter permease [Labrys monachus]|uniref:Spermidine/putrescine transport system permease protein n=1 Tax=Labrys monachus TaxID=217067 RepID=A0ABU0FFK2_9HYPH|nr:ABC transporter permease subunit [Labrys monachus]MDQ0393379.1 putative spermidine/putrescine transport system permease protein [Labrys monachus]